MTQEDPGPPQCVTHEQEQGACHWDYVLGRLTPLQRAQCSDANGPGWLPPGYVMLTIVKAEEAP